MPSFQIRESLPPTPIEELFDAEETGQTSARIWMSLTGFARLRQQSVARTAWQRAVPFGTLLRTRVRLLGWTWPLSAVVGLALAVVAGATLGVVLMLAPWLRPAPALASPPLPDRAPAPDSEMVSVPELTRAQRAALGDDAAMGELARRSPGELSPEELLAIQEGKRLQRRQRLAELGDELAASPDGLRDPNVARRLSKELDDAVLHIEVLRILAHVEHPLGPDLLLAISEDRTREGGTRALAGALLSTRLVREHASPALSVVLDLAEVEDCQLAARAVDAAIQAGDRRSLPALTALTKVTGCGPVGGDDCHPCLRSDGSLRQALEAVAQRGAPALPHLVRPIVAAPEPGERASIEAKAAGASPAPAPPPAAPGGPRASSARDPGF